MIRYSYGKPTGSSLRSSRPGFYVDSLENQSLTYSKAGLRPRRGQGDNFHTEAVKAFGNYHASIAAVAMANDLNRSPYAHPSHWAPFVLMAIGCNCAASHLNSEQQTMSSRVYA